MTPAEAYTLHRAFAGQFTTYTSDHPEGTNVVPPVEQGRTEYVFRDSGVLAEFLSYVLANRRLPDWPIAAQFKDAAQVIDTLECSKTGRAQDATLVAACWIAAHWLTQKT